MAKDERPIEVGDRFETRDSRDAGRVVEVVEARGISGRGERQIELARARYRGRATTDWGELVTDAVEFIRQGYTYFSIRTEAHPRNPDALGNVSRISERTLRTKYRRVSR